MSAALQKYFIRDLETGTTYFFHAMPSSGYTISKSVSWNATEIIGRSSPLQGYRGSEPSTFTLSIPLFSSINQGDGGTTARVVQFARFFWSLAYPDYGDGIKPPHRCLLVTPLVGEMDVVVTSVNINDLGPWDASSGEPHHVIVDVTFIEVDDIPKDYKDVRR